MNGKAIKDDSIQCSGAILHLTMQNNNEIRVVPPITIYRGGSGQVIPVTISIRSMTGQIVKENTLAIQGSGGKIHLRQSIQSLEWVCPPQKDKTAPPKPKPSVAVKIKKPKFVKPMVLQKPKEEVKSNAPKKVDVITVKKSNTADKPPTIKKIQKKIKQSNKKRK
jgi:hypothetical protein